MGVRDDEREGVKMKGVERGRDGGEDSEDREETRRDKMR